MTHHESFLHHLREAVKYAPSPHVRAALQLLLDDDSGDNGPPPPAPHGHP